MILSLEKELSTLTMGQFLTFAETSKKDPTEKDYGAGEAESATTASSP